MPKYCAAVRPTVDLVN